MYIKLFDLTEAEKILLKYWGYPKFRELQQEIINSILEGKDTLGLMPTGGGKSITFQVPTMMREGICIVVTPLIALMKDQVENLKAKEIRAAAIYSGMSYHEIDMTLDNCIYGNYKFLYVSPERLSTDIFIERLKKMNVNLLAIDESHCISQWGYDFRPSYLKINEIRQYLKGVPVLALTATATPKVVDDIQEKLNFKEKNVFRKSFERKNLIYLVRKSEDKEAYLLNVARKVKGTGIIYVRNRRKTMQIAKFLRENGISADYYHAGLTNEQREQKQNNWKNDKTRIIVSTNAFGMGIDKPNVRYVIHIDIPNSLEAYYQEAGRGGRDEKTAYAVLLYNNEDIENLRKQIKDNFPEISFIKRVYNLLGNYLNIAIGSGKNHSFKFNIRDFASKYKLEVLETYSAIKFLQKEGYIYFTESVFIPSKIIFTVNRQALYDFQLKDKAFDYIIKLILRNYSGVFDEYVNISESFLAKQAGLKEDVMTKYLIALSKNGIINYAYKLQEPIIQFMEERLDDKNLKISKENYETRKKIFIETIEYVINYASSDNKCRSQLLLAYFGETDTYRCGNCDVCKRRNELGLSKYEFDIILEEIKKELKNENIMLNDLIPKIKYKSNKVVMVIRWLLDNEKIKYDKDHKLYWF